MTFKLFHNRLNLLVVVKVTSVSVLQWNRISSQPSVQTQMTNSPNTSVSVSQPTSRHYRSLVIKVLLLSHLSPTRVPLLRLIWLDAVFKLSVAPTCSCWVLRSILVTSFCQRQHVWFISSSVNHETSVCLAVRGHRASSRRNFEVTSTLESASRSMFALLKHTQIYRSQVEFGRRVVAQ